MDDTDARAHGAGLVLIELLVALTLNHPTLIADITAKFPDKSAGDPRVDQAQDLMRRAGERIKP